MQLLILSSLLLLPLLANAKVNLEAPTDRPKTWSEGDRSAVACNTNSHTCKDKTLTNEICAEQCYCDVDSGMITCKKWSGCHQATVDWNCKCHSADVPPKGTCPGWYSMQEGVTAEKTGKWPPQTPNKVDAHPNWQLAGLQ